MTRWAPGEEHLAVLVHPVLLFLGLQQVVGVDVFEPDKTRLQPARAAFSTKFGMRWQSVSTWMMPG